MISACYTTYQRTTLLFQAVENALDHEFVSEIVITDDCSSEPIFKELEAFASQHSKIKLFRNEVNKDCYVSKFLSVQRASNEWVAILDSDNRFPKDYFNRLENLFIAGLNPKTVYHPDFAKPHFNFTSLSGLNLTRQNIANYIDDDKCQVMLNAFNYFVNRSEYLRIFDSSTDPVTSDSIFHNYNWLNAGNSIYVVPSLQYEHRVNDHGSEEPSHYGRNVQRTQAGFHQSILEKLKAMR